MEGIENNKKKKVLIPNRGVVALDIINSLKSIGFETILLHSPEDAMTLPVKLADKSYKFFSSRLEDSYLDMEAIIDMAIDLKVDYIHPGYGFLAEDPAFFRLCEKHKIKVIGPGSEVLETVADKLKLREIARELGIKIMPHSPLIKTSAEIEPALEGLKHPMIIKPITGSGGKGIRVAEFANEAREQIEAMLKREEIRKKGIIVEEFIPFAHQIEIPFFRDVKGNILFLPEIEASVQRRFQKIFQESPSVNVTDSMREILYKDSQKLIERLEYVGLGYVEFIVDGNKAYFSEINPTFQINTLVPEIHIISNLIKKQFAISNGELLHNVEGVEIINPKYHILLVSLMAENPLNKFQPSSGTVSEFFYYSTIRNLFKTNIYAGARISPLYDPYIGKIVTFSTKREQALEDMRNFMETITIKGIKTNLNFLKHLLKNDYLGKGKTFIDFLNLKCDFLKKQKTEEDILIATALFSAAFHNENRRKNFKASLEKMKQPGFFKRLFNQL